MSIIDKLLNSVRLSDEDYEDDYEYEEVDDYQEEKRGFFGFGRKKKEVDEIEDSNDNPRSKLTSIRGGKSSSDMQVCVIKPSSFNDATEVADTLLSNNTVILNIEGMNHEDAQRIIDFMIGTCYAIDGNLQSITKYIFIITPKAVSLTGDIKGLVEAFDGARLASGSLQSF